MCLISVIWISVTKCSCLCGSRSRRNGNIVFNGAVERVGSVDGAEAQPADKGARAAVRGRRTRARKAGPVISKGLENIAGPWDRLPEQPRFSVPSHLCNVLLVLRVQRPSGCVQKILCSRSSRLCLCVLSTSHVSKSPTNPTSSCNKNGCVHLFMRRPGFFFSPFKKNTSSCNAAGWIRTFLADRLKCWSLKPFTLHKKRFKVLIWSRQDKYLKWVS